ncbi:hypothetical protein BVX94_00600 [bacterium B17]|nr:hypothetical protein BVX94_00600 [bacterium B17]
MSTENTSVNHGKKAPLSVLIITYNEEVNIRESLESVVDWAGEVFVVDSFSSDQTVAICKEYEDKGVKVFQHEFENYSAQRNWALQELPWSNEWLFWIDADEIVTLELGRELMDLAVTDSFKKDFYYVKRRLIFLGKWIKHSSSYPLWLIRLFRIKDARFTRPINEQVVVPGDGGRLEHDLLHDDKKGIAGWLEKHNRYSSMEAEEYLKVLENSEGDQDFLNEKERPDVKRQKKLRFFIHLPFRPFFMFAYLYFWKLGFLDGKAGLIYCMLKAGNQRSISAKMQELKVARSKN